MSSKRLNKGSAAHGSRAAAGSGRGDGRGAGGELAAADWRPVTMMVFVFIVANNYVIAPYAQAIFDRPVALPTPPDLWELIKIGLGGYVVGRSAEKCVAAWKG